MKCKKCDDYIEMKMYKVEEDKMIFKCKQCGNTETVDIAEIEKNK